MLLKNLTQNDDLDFLRAATWWIKQAIERAIMNKARIIRLPIHVIKELYSYLKTAKEIANKLDHELSSEDIAKALNKTPQEVNKLLCLSEAPLSLDIPLGDDDGKSLLETLTDYNSYSTEELLENNNTKKHIHEGLNLLNAKQRAIITNRFGLINGISATLDEVANEVGLSAELVRQIQEGTLKKLRLMLKRRGLD